MMGGLSRPRIEPATHCTAVLTLPLSHETNRFSGITVHFDIICAIQVR